MRESGGAIVGPGPCPPPINVREQRRSDDDNSQARIPGKPSDPAGGRPCLRHDAQRIGIAEEPLPKQSTSLGLVLRINVREQRRCDDNNSQARIPGKPPDATGGRSCLRHNARAHRNCGRIHSALAMAPMLCAAAIPGSSGYRFRSRRGVLELLCDPQGSRSQRLKAMTIFTAMGVVVMPLASYAAHWGLCRQHGHPVYPGLPLWTDTVLQALARAHAGAGGVDCLARGRDRIASPEPLAAALAHGGYFLLGSAWTMLFGIFLWPIPFPQSAGFMLATIFGRLEDMAGFSGVAGFAAWNGCAGLDRVRYRLSPRGAHVDRARQGIGCA